LGTHTRCWSDLGGRMPSATCRPAGRDRCRTAIPVRPTASNGRLPSTSGPSQKYQAPAYSVGLAEPDVGPTMWEQDTTTDWVSRRRRQPDPGYPAPLPADGGRCRPRDMRTGAGPVAIPDAESFIPSQGPSRHRWMVPTVVSKWCGWFSAGAHEPMDMAAIQKGVAGAGRRTRSHGAGGGQETRDEGEVETSADNRHRLRSGADARAGQLPPSLADGVGQMRLVIYEEVEATTAVLGDFGEGRCAIVGGSPRRRRLSRMTDALHHSRSGANGSLPIRIEK